MQGNLSTVVLCGGVGGARMAQGFVRLLRRDRLTLVVNVGDDDTIYGAHVSADLDTVMYTLAGIQGPDGWGIADDTFVVMDHLAGIGLDTTFRLGDRDLANCLARTAALADGIPLSDITRLATARLGVEANVVPVSDDPVRTRVRNDRGTWFDFQDYFVRRRHRDPVVAIAFDGASAAVPAPGVLSSIEAADVVVVAPSNPPLSIWPILAVPGVRDAVAAKDLVVAVSPLFGGRAVKGPAAEVLAGLGLPPGTDGIVAAYDGLISDLVIDVSDAGDIDRVKPGFVRLHARDTRISDAAAAERLARELLAIAQTVRTVGAAP